MSRRGERFLGSSRRLIRFSVLAGSIGLSATLGPSAWADETPEPGCTSSSSDPDQQVTVCRSDEQDSYRSSEGGSTCGGSQVTVVTDEGTSHPSGGSGACPAVPTPAPAAQQTGASVATSRATAAPLPTTSPLPGPVQAPPPITVTSERAPIMTLDTTPKREGLPIALIGLIASAIALAAGGYLGVRTIGGRLRPLARQLRPGGWNEPPLSDLLFMDDAPVLLRWNDTSPLPDPDREPVPEPPAPPPPEPEPPEVELPAPGPPPEPPVPIPVKRYSLIAPELALIINSEPIPIAKPQMVTALPVPEPSPPPNTEADILAI